MSHTHFYCQPSKHPKKKNQIKKVERKRRWFFFSKYTHTVKVKIVRSSSTLNRSACGLRQSLEHALARHVVALDSLEQVCVVRLLQIIHTDVVVVWFVL